MSHVTDIIIITRLEESDYAEDVYPNIEELSKYIKTEFSSSGFNIVSTFAGGNKAVQADIFMCAVNGMDIPKFLTKCKTIKWNDPDSIQILIKDEHWELFKMYSVNNIEV